MQRLLLLSIKGRIPKTFETNQIVNMKLRNNLLSVLNCLPIHNRCNLLVLVLSSYDIDYIFSKILSQIKRRYIVEAQIQLAGNIKSSTELFTVV